MCPLAYAMRFTLQRIFLYEYTHVLPFIGVRAKPEHVEPEGPLTFEPDRSLRASGWSSWYLENTQDGDPVFRSSHSILSMFNVVCPNAQVRHLCSSFSSGCTHTQDLFRTCLRMYLCSGSHDLALHSGMLPILRFLLRMYSPSGSPQDSPEDVLMLRFLPFPQDSVLHSGTASSRKRYQWTYLFGWTVDASYPGGMYYYRGLH